MNPRHTEALKAVDQRLRPQLLDLRIYTETALMADATKQVVVSNDNDTRVGMRDGISARAVTLPAQGARYGSPRTVRVVNLADFIGGLTRGLDSVNANPTIPIVVRMDIEGTEYAVLRDLAASGAARARRLPIFLCIEWHRFVKRKSVAAAELGLIARLDRSMAHYNRAGNGANKPDKTAGSRFAASSAFENYEKELVLRLAAANFLTVESLGALEDWQQSQKRPSAPRRANNTNPGRVTTG